jgi:polysaccharide pyruvyl transferase WcaK-like protein
VTTRRNDEHVTAMNLDVHMVPHYEPFESDLVVHGGGTQFFSFPLTHYGWRKKIKTAFLDPARAFRYMANLAGFRKKDVTKFSTALGFGIGPFVPGSHEEKSAREVVKHFNFTAARDHDSLTLLESWGVSNVMLGSDLCFVPNTWDYLALSQKQRPHSPCRVGVIVMDWNHTNEGKPYEDSLPRVVEVLRTTGYQVQYVIFNPNEDPRWLKLLRTLGEPFLLWDPPRTGFKEFVEKLAEFDLIITTRFHGAVFAAILGIPFISIEVGLKLKQAADLLCSSGLLWCQPFRVEECTRLVQQVFSHYAESVEQVAEGVRQQRYVAESMVEKFEEFLREHFHETRNV